MANRILIFGSLLTPFALYFGGSMAMDHVERQGWRFFNSGKDIVTTLGSMAKAAQAKDAAAIQSFYAPDYTGSPLGTYSAHSRSKKRTERTIQLRVRWRRGRAGCGAGGVAALPRFVRIDRRGADACASSVAMGFGSGACGGCTLRADRNAQRSAAIGHRPRLLPHDIRLHSGGSLKIRRPR